MNPISADFSVIDSSNARPSRDAAGEADESIGCTHDEVRLFWKRMRFVKAPN